MLAGLIMAVDVSRSAAASTSTAFVHLGPRRASVRGLGAPAVSSLSSSSLRMRVEVDVKDRVADGVVPLTRGAGKGAVTTVPPPIPRDNFKHKSNADLPKECGPYMKVGRFQLNPFGVWFMLNAMLLAVPWSLVLAVLNATIGFIEKVDPTRTIVDLPCRLWARAIIVLGLSYPDITGLENMPEGPVVSEGGREGGRRQLGLSRHACMHAPLGYSHSS